jgi:hypothetical protein
MNGRIDAFFRWLDQPSRASERWLGKHCVFVAWVGLAVAIFSPPHGSGIPVCYFHYSTGLPCPGCGMMRSLSCGIRGMFLESWKYHPMGLFVLALFMFTAAQSVFPRANRGAIVGFIQERAKAFNVLYAAFVITFVGFGLLRAVFHLGEAGIIHR